jgi:hypothetical protein
MTSVNIPKVTTISPGVSVYEIDTSYTSTGYGDPAIIVSGGKDRIVNITSALTVNGRDVMREIDEMRDALLLLKRDVDMESKYPRLKELKDAYEQELAKYKTFDTLKESK